ncbi:MAG: glycosyltransferase [Candidatus Omnitrophota bacterium]
MIQNKLRILHCPTDTGGNSCGLAFAEQKVGLNSWSIAFRKSYINYTCSETLWSDNENYIAGEAKRWRLLWRAIRDFDVIHFNFGRSIMPHRIPQKILKRNIGNPLLRGIYGAYAALFELRDIPLLKRMGKGIVVTYQGSDARQSMDSPSRWNDRKKARIEVFSKYADRIYALNPDLLRVLPERSTFMPYTHIDLQEWSMEKKAPRDLSVPLVIHAPTHKEIKGTKYILDAVDRLKKEGVDFEFKLVEGLSNAEARKIYERADLCIDQLLVGWYGGLSVELMALSKPVICYIREEDLKFIPREMADEIPIINATPSTMYGVLKEWLTGRKNELSERGAAGRKYVERWHDPLKIAEMLKREYDAIVKRPKIVSSPKYKSQAPRNDNDGRANSNARPSRNDGIEAAMTSRRR